jgi:hypothetical protein
MKLQQFLGNKENANVSFTKGGYTKLEYGLQHCSLP